MASLREDTKTDNTVENRNTSTEGTSGRPTGKRKAPGYKPAAIVALLLLCAAAIVSYQYCNPAPLESPPDNGGDFDTIPEAESDTVPPEPYLLVRHDSIPDSGVRPNPSPKLVEIGTDCYTIAEIPVFDKENQSEILTTIPYGIKVLRLKDITPDFVLIKYGRIKGLARISDLLNEEDYHLLESIFHSGDALEAVPQAEFRRALLDYYKSHDMVHRPQQWQFVLNTGLAKPNEVLFRQIFPGDGNKSDMAIILEEVKTGNRKIVIFKNGDKQTVRAAFEATTYPAPYTIADVSASRYNLKIKYAFPGNDSIETRYKSDIYDEYHGRYIRH